MPQPHSLLSLISNVRRNIPSRPPSPTFSEATQASVMNFGETGPSKIITRANLRTSVQAYEELMNASTAYRAALLTMSKVTAAFADAMEKCSGLKGASYETGTRLQAASGLHHLIGNHWHILAETLDKKFEKPLRQQLGSYRAIIAERSAAYERTLYEKSGIIHSTELATMNKKARNLQSFREALSIMQRQVDELDMLKSQHYQEVLEHEEEVWDGVQAKVCLLVRSTLDIFDKFTAKSSDPVIETMLQTIPDPFDSYGPPPSEDQIFSILPPLSINGSPASASSSLAGTPAQALAPDLPVWMPAQPNHFFPDVPSPTSWMDVASSSSKTTLPTHRAASPPGRRHFTDSGGTHSPQTLDTAHREPPIPLSATEGCYEASEDGGETLRSSSVNGDAAAGTSWDQLDRDTSPPPPPHGANDGPTPRSSVLFTLPQRPDDLDRDADADKCQTPDSVATTRIPLPS